MTLQQISMKLRGLLRQLESLKEIVQRLNTHGLPKLKQEDINNVNDPPQAMGWKK